MRGILVPVALANLAIAPRAAADHWTQGDQQPHCYTAPTGDAASTSNGMNMGTPGATIQLSGFDMKWVQPLPTDNLTPDTKLVASVIVILSRTFYKDNSSLLGNFTGSGLGPKLCFDKINPADGAQSCAVSPRTDQNCCIWHANIHACKVGPGVICEPWVQPTNDTTTGHVLVTDTPTIFGVPSEPLNFDQGLFLGEGRWYIIGHIKMNNFQCAIGVQRTINANAASSQVSLHHGLDATKLAAVIVGGVVALALITAAVIIFALRRKAKHSAGDCSDDGRLRRRMSDNDSRRNSMAAPPSSSCPGPSARESFVIASSSGLVSPTFIPMNQARPDYYVADPYHQQQVVTPAEVYAVAPGTYFPPASGTYVSAVTGAVSEPYISPTTSPTAYLPTTTLPYVPADNIPALLVSQGQPYSRPQTYSLAQQHSGLYAQGDARRPISAGEVYEMLPANDLRCPLAEFNTRPPSQLPLLVTSPLAPFACAAMARTSVPVPAGAPAPAPAAAAEGEGTPSPVESQTLQNLAIVNP